MNTSVRITSQTVRADFNDLPAVVHYTRAAHFLGLWASERLLIERYFPDRGARLLEAGCGAGRVSFGLWDLGCRQIAAFDFAEELLTQAKHLARERGVRAIRFFHADATQLDRCTWLQETVQAEGAFDGVLFMFNGLMQIPGRDQRRQALRGLGRVCRPGGMLLFTTHDREDSRAERVLWRLEAQRWTEGAQDPRLVEFGDRYFEDEAGRTFMHLPTRAEILEDLAATGWEHVHDVMRRDVAAESPAVRNFSDECRFWAARQPEGGL